MVAALPNFRGGLKISDQNNWGGPEQKIILFGGGEEAMNASDAMVSFC